MKKINWKKSLLALATITIWGIVMLVLYKNSVAPVRENRVLVQKNGSEKVLALKEGKELTQSFTAPEDYLEQIGVRFHTYDRSNPGTLRVVLRETKSGEEIQNWEFAASQVTDGIMTVLGLEVPLTDAKEKEYTIGVTLNGAKGNESIGVYRAGKSFAYTVRGEKEDTLKHMWMTLAAALAVMLVIILIGIFRSWSIERMFLPVAFAVGMIYLFVIPVMAGPDETRHQATIYQYSSIILGEDTVDEEGRTITRVEDTEERYGIERFPTRESYASIYRNFWNRELDESRAVIRKPLSANPLVYLPQIAGVTLARVLHLNGIQLYTLGRIFGLIFALIMVYFAIKLLPAGKMVMFAVALLPMTMQQFAILSYDCVINALSFLFIGYVLHLAYAKESVGWKELILPAMMMMVIVPTKIVYIFLVLLFLLIPREKFTFRYGNIIGILAVMAAGVIAMKLFNATAAADILSRTTNTVQWGDEPSYTLAMILEDPLAAIRIFLRSFLERGPEYLGGMLGLYLCKYYGIRVPFAILAGFFVILLAAALFEKERNVKFDRKTRGLMIVISLAVIGSASLSMMLAYTSVYSPVLQGVQGRYFLPVLPLILLCLLNEKEILKRDASHGLIWGMGILHLFTLTHVFSSIVIR